MLNNTIELNKDEKQKILIKSPIEPLSTGKKCINIKIRRLLEGGIKERFISKEKYTFLRKNGKTDDEIVEQIKTEAEKVGLSDLFNDRIYEKQFRKEKGDFL